MDDHLFPALGWLLDLKKTGTGEMSLHKKVGRFCFDILTLYVVLLYDLAFSSANNDQNECNYESVLHSSGTGLTGFHQLTVSPKVCVFFVQTNN